MTPPFHIDLAQYSPRTRWFMVVAWLVILVKCWIVWWAVDRWHMPFHAAWVIAPTIAFALLASVLWLAHQRYEE